MLTVSEAAAVTGITRTHINRILDDRHLANVLKIKRIDGRRVLNLNHCVFVLFHEHAGKLLMPKTRKDVWCRYMEKVTQHRNEKDFRITDNDSLVVILGNSVSIDMTPHFRDVLQSWEALERSKTEIVTDPEVRDGVAVIGGTRIGAHEVAGIAEKSGIDEVLAIYPSLDVEKVEAAVMYAKAHPRAGRPSTNEAWRSPKVRLKSSKTVRREPA
jgi:uncharacterized protein (DUF433 family)